MWSLLANSDNPTDWRALFADDETQTDGVERLKRVPVPWDAGMRVDQNRGGIPFALSESVMANETRL